MFNIIIFSKDRASQLEFLLRTMLKFFKEYEKSEISIIYKATNSQFLKSYKTLIKNYRKPRFILEKEGQFKKQVLDSIKKNNKFTFFLVDDNCFIDNFSSDTNEFRLFRKRKDILTLSLRMNPHISYSYTQCRNINPPQLSKNHLWNWKKCQNESYWGYPMSLDGHIFRTNEIKKVIKIIQFINPNYFEKELSKNPIKKDKMICYERSKIVNLAVNRVQEVYKNRSGKISLDKLNNLFISGKVISLKTLNNISNKSVHQEIPLIIENR